MKKTSNYGLALYDKEDKMIITAEKNSLNANMEIIDSKLKDKVDETYVDNKIAEAQLGWGTAELPNGLKGKKVSILGDSISTYAGWLTPSTNAVYYPTCQNSPYADITSVNETWWKIVIDKTQMVLGANNSYSGRTLKDSATINNIEALANNGTPDLILVYLGTNDANQQVSLGKIDKTMPFNYNSSESYGETLGTNLTQEQIEALGTSTFYEAVRTLIIRLQWYYPNARIVFLTLGWGSYQRFFADNPYREALKEMCELYGVDTIDVRKAGISMPKFTDYTLQRVHPNKAGMKLLGEYVYNKLMALYGYSVDEASSLILESLTYTGTLNKTEYIEGESLSLNGLTFTANYTDGTSEIISNNKLSVAPITLIAGTTTATVSYTFGGIKKSVSISGFTVEESNIILENISVSGTLVKTEYNHNEEFDPTGLTFNAEFSDSTSRQIEYEALRFSPSPLTEGTTSVVVSYTFNGITKTVTIDGITVEPGNNDLEYDELEYATKSVSRGLRGGVVPYLICRSGVLAKDIHNTTVTYIEGIYVDNPSYTNETKILKVGKVTAPNIFDYTTDSGSATGAAIFREAINTFEEIATIDLSGYTDKSHFVIDNINVEFGENDYLCFDVSNCHSVGFVDSMVTTRNSMCYMYENLNGSFWCNKAYLLPLKVKYHI